MEWLCVIAGGCSAAREGAMFSSRYKRAVLVVTMLSTGGLFRAVAQSSLSGDLAGSVTDPSGAVISAAPVDLKSLETGATLKTATGPAGNYRFTLLKPGRYSVSVIQPGFQTAEHTVDVAVGKVATSDFVLAVGTASQVIEVTESASLLNPEASINIAFSPREIELLPSAGGDITNVAFTGPGVVLNNVGGVGTGNFSVNGLPGTSNLFTINGENDMDPYFNVNNSGATNLTLGQNEVQEATVVTNPYAAEYGTAAGAQVIYVTKSGGNTFHGNAQYWWNGRALNSNDFFNNLYGEPTPFSNANQWAGSTGGPIRKNRTFFYFDTEGLRFVLPNVKSTTIPTAAFANAVLTNVQLKDASEAAAYSKLFQLYAGAPGAADAAPIANTSACDALTLPGFNPKTQACAERFESNPSALASEYIIVGRVDHKLSDNDNAFFRYKLDHGTQPTTLDPINAAFNAISSQPAWDAQLSETHILGPRSTNLFLASFSHYDSQFAQNHQLATSTFPYEVANSGVVPFTNFNLLGDFPQGRNYSQYQFLDDFTVIRGKHDLKFGANFRRYDISDHNFFYNSPAVYFGYNNAGLQNFTNGLAYQYRENLNLASDVPIASWGLGLYANDDWHVKSNLKLTLGLRVERNSNPVCQFNCFANFKGAFSGLPSVTSANGGNVPYSSDIATGEHQAFPGIDALDWSPRAGFSWAPFRDNKTVLSGGFGIFYDALPGSVVDDLLSNPPDSVAIRVRPAAGIAPFDPGPTGGAATWAASANAFNINSTFTQISSNLKKLGAVFAVPAVESVVGTIHAPMWEEWNLQIQRELTGSTVMAVNFVGNHGSRIPYSNTWPNAYDLYQIFPGVRGIPAAAPDSNYGQVTQIQSGAISNYDALQITVRQQFKHGMAAHFNYAWSHNLDEVSNGGINSFGGEALTSQINPLSLAANNYGNSDYDIRHNVNGDFIYTPQWHFGNHLLNQVLGGWQLSSKVYWRTGLPFSIVDGNWNGALGNGSATILATPLGTVSGQSAGGCGAAAVNTPCLNAAAFLNSGAASFNNFTAVSSQTRNQYRGPQYFDVDMSLFKSFKIGEKVNMAVGATAFNVLNHPSFGLPDNFLGDSTFGQVTSTTTTPTSPYGSGLGFDSGPRSVQLSAKLVF
jgi:hypothetical protein